MNQSAFNRYATLKRIHNMLPVKLYVLENSINGVEHSHLNNDTFVKVCDYLITHLSSSDMVLLNLCRNIKTDSLILTNLAREKSLSKLSNLIINSKQEIAEQLSKYLNRNDSLPELIKKNMKYPEDLSNYNLYQRLLNYETDTNQHQLTLSYYSNLNEESKSILVSTLLNSAYFLCSDNENRLILVFILALESIGEIKLNKGLPTHELWIDARKQISFDNK